MTTQIRELSLSPAMQDLQEAALQAAGFQASPKIGLSRELVDLHASRPHEALRGARQRVTEVIGSTTLLRALAYGQSPADSYLGAYAELTVQLDREVYPDTAAVTRQQQHYVPDRFVDMGESPMYETVLRRSDSKAREKNVIDKAEILHRYAPLLEQIFSPEIAHMPAEERDLLVAKMIARQVYRTIPYEDTDRGVGKKRASEDESGVCRDQASLAVVLAQAAGLRAEKVKANVQLGNTAGRHALIAVQVGEEWFLIDQTNPKKVPKKRSDLDIEDVLVIPAGTSFANRVGQTYGARLPDGTQYTYEVTDPSYWHIETSAYVDGDVDGGGYTGRMESRRAFLESALGTLTYYALRNVLGGGEKITSRLVQSNEQLQSEEVKTMSGEVLKRANDFIGMALGPDRDVAEAGFWEWMATKQQELTAYDIRLGMSASFSLGARAVGMELFWIKRQKGELAAEGFPPLDPELIQWAEQNQLDPGTLAFTIDAQAAAKKLLSAKPDIFFEALPEAERPTTPEQVHLHIMNPGGMTELMQWETGSTYKPTGKRYAFINVGSVPAQHEWNQSDEYFPNSDQHLKDVLERQKKATGLAYNQAVVPGSKKGEGDSSGGAIGPQLMPVWANFFMRAYDQANATLPEAERLADPNVWDPFTGAVLATLFISSDFHARSTSIDKPDRSEKAHRPGYKKSDKDAIISSLNKWNPLEDEVSSVYEAALDFYSHFPQY